MQITVASNISQAGSAFWVGADKPMARSRRLSRNHHPVTDTRPRVPTLSQALVFSAGHPTIQACSVFCLSGRGVDLWNLDIERMRKVGADTPFANELDMRISGPDAKDNL